MVDSGQSRLKGAWRASITQWSYRTGGQELSTLRDTGSLLMTCPWTKANVHSVLEHFFWQDVGDIGACADFAFQIAFRNQLFKCIDHGIARNMQLFCQLSCRW